VVMALVLNAGWTQFGISLFTMHDQFVPPVPPIPALPSIPGLVEGPAFMGWPPGFFVHKKAQTVLVDGNPGIQQGHDVGYLIPHFAVPMNALCGVHTLLSKHKVMFPVSSVLLEGKPVGTYLLGLLGLICSNPVSLPAGGIVVLENTVMTSASAFDILKGALYIGLEIGFDVLWNKYKKLLPKFLTGTRADLVSDLESYLADTGVEELNCILQQLGKESGAALEIAAIDIANKIMQSLLKSWIASPLVGSLPRGSTGIGRGKAGVTWKPFGELW
jgi:hypothetical protein